MYIQARDDNIRHGSSLAGLVELATSHGYTLIETCVFNAFFVPNDVYTQYFQDLVPDTSIEVLHDITMGTKMYVKNENVVFEQLFFVHFICLLCVFFLLCWSVPLFMVQDFSIIDIFYSTSEVITDTHVKHCVFCQVR